MYTMENVVDLFSENLPVNQTEYPCKIARGRDSS